MLFWNTVMSVLFLPLMEIRDKDWNFYLGLEIVVHRVIFFFQTPLIRTFPTLLMPLLNSWARGMKKWSKNRACQFRSVRPLKISNLPELIWKPKRISCARKLENQVLPSKKFSRKKIGINFPIFSQKNTVFEMY